MKKDDLIALGIDEEIAKKVMDLNGADIQREETKLKSANELLSAAQTSLATVEKDRDQYKGQLETLTEKLQGFEDVDISAKDGTIKQLREDLEGEKRKHAEELARIRRSQETQAFFASLESPFCNDETRDAYMSKMEAALCDPANVGKSRKELLDAMVVGEDGQPKANIFQEPINPNPLNIPPAGKLPEEEPKKDVPKSMFF